MPYCRSFILYYVISFVLAINNDHNNNNNNNNNNKSKYQSQTQLSFWYIQLVATKKTRRAIMRVRVHAVTWLYNQRPHRPVIYPISSPLAFRFFYPPSLYNSQSICVVIIDVMIMIIIIIELINQLITLLRSTVFSVLWTDTLINHHCTPWYEILFIGNPVNT